MKLERWTILSGNEAYVRDDFRQRIIDRLAKRAGNVCSNPECGKPTFGAAAGHDGFVNVGVACHITAAAPGGPRYRVCRLYRIP